MPRPEAARPPSVLGAALVVALGSGATALALGSVLEFPQAAAMLVSDRLWRAAVGALGGSIEGTPDAPTALVPFGSLLVILLVASAAAWLAGGWLVARSRGRSWGEGLARWGQAGWLWWLVPGAWEAARLLAFLAGFTRLHDLLLSIPNFIFAFVLAGWGATFFTLCCRVASPGAIAAGGRPPVGLWLGMGAYFVVFGAMNVLLWRNLLVPHGDSAMFEEHLWNVTHGKGFRSFIDGHVFLGEHFQVVHLFLLPLYVLWPSHVLLELCQSAALAAGALPVFWMGARRTGSRGAGLLLACAYLLYFPMQMLDIDIVGKTFRLEAFGLTLLLFGLDALDRGRLARTALFLILALTAREDFAIVYAPLGVWVAGRGYAAGRRAAGEGKKERRRLMTFGLATAVLSVAYVLFVVKVGIPWFRGGEPHYVSYFGQLGASLDEVLWNVAANPVRLVRALATQKTLLYAAALLLSVGFLPLLSPGRLAVGLPLFVTLCLNELSPGPVHHFHAPIVPVLFWAAAAGLGRVPVLASKLGGNRDVAARWAAHFTWAGALGCGLFFTVGPLGLPFWDAGSPQFYWKDRYVRGPRAEAFPKVFAAIPPDARVAATDYPHTRFTHHDRSYDYSRYGRAVNGGRPGAPLDSDFIVIDVEGSQRDLGISRPEQVPEYRERPERWEVLPDETGGRFVVLQRRWSPREREVVRRQRVPRSEAPGP